MPSTHSVVGDALDYARSRATRAMLLDLQVKVDNQPHGCDPHLLPIVVLEQLARREFGQYVGGQGCHRYLSCRFDSFICRACCYRKNS